MLIAFWFWDSLKWKCVMRCIYSRVPYLGRLFGGNVIPTSLYLRKLRPTLPLLTLILSLHLHLSKWKRRTPARHSNNILRRCNKYSPRIYSRNECLFSDKKCAGSKHASSIDRIRFRVKLRIIWVFSRIEHWTEFGSILIDCLTGTVKPD